MIRRGAIPFCLALALLMIGAGNKLRPPPAQLMEELQVMVPIPMQILSAFGDRYLAANIGTWRAIMVGVRQLPPDELNALAQIQLSAAWLNPGQEDNYYAATAILPWAGKVTETQQILALASTARPHDIYAPFFHGFNALHFQQDFITAAHSARLAASYADNERERQALLLIATRWSEKSDDPEMALGIVKQMAEEARNPALRAHLQLRVTRLKGLTTLHAAAQDYRTKYRQPLLDLNQLVTAGLLPNLPTDPLGGGYALKDEWPVLLPPKE